MIGPGTQRKISLLQAQALFSVTQKPRDIPGNVGKFLKFQVNSGKAWEIHVNPGQELLVYSKIKLSRRAFVSHVCVPAQRKYITGMSRGGHSMGFL